MVRRSSRKRQRRELTLDAQVWPVERLTRQRRAERRALRRDGFVVCPRFLGDASLGFLRAEYDAVLASKHASVHDEWVLGLHSQLSDERNWMLRLATLPALVAEVAAALQTEHVVLYCSQLAYKPAGGGGRRVPWHQDGCSAVLTCWIALDDIHEDSGGLVFKPGWHERGRLPLRRVETKRELADAEFDAQNNVFRAEVGEEASFSRGSVRVLLPAGGMSMHHPAAPHCSAPNTSARPRRAIILRYMAGSEPEVGGHLKHWLSGRPCEKRSVHIVRPRDGCPQRVWLTRSPRES